MLLRSVSSPILKSSISVSAETSPGSTNHLRLSSLSLPPRSSAAPTRSMSESNTSELFAPPVVPKRKERVAIIQNEEDREAEESASINQSSSSIGLQQGLLAITGLDAQARPQPPSLVLDEGCVGDGGSGGRICSGGASGESGFFSDSNKNMDAYYREMIQANPSDPLLLGNYAKYLKEVRGDLDKAEEYCERAILANQEDGGTLSMYADITWERSKDAERAEAYFDRAVRAAPEDCYIAASYARFLWDADEEEEEEEEEEGKKENMTEVKAAIPASRTPPPFFPGQATTSAIAAAS
ncbi:uncharacterized protein M6B38_415415 [Iris pallida]|uniref:Uncharacterized protein n=1 Tax=Iris pallida TaxID=29817 RepID=A0AAX6FL76_IRIPA|nr:uncharacterized protein M6B38_415415 [Iris pallida]